MVKVIAKTLALGPANPEAKLSLELPQPRRAYDAAQRAALPTTSIRTTIRCNQQDMIRDGLAVRQISASPTPTTPITATNAAATFSSDAVSSLCTIALPSGGILSFNDTYTYVLDDGIIFEAACDSEAFNHVKNGNSTVVHSNDPFYASVAPNIYALATATVISYILVILIFITPRTFYVGGPGGGASFLGLRSLVPGSGSSSIIGVGRRPLLQKVAAITVAISLTIATADTFRVAERQYNDGLMDSQHLVDDVIGSVEIRVVRVISDTFLWLAQVQTLIRLFPRHKEKVTIKWLGFAMVTCDTVFSILENFVSQTTLTRPRSFQDAIPALSYLFQMAISLIYASCVIYYSLSKRRFAFWHLKMKNILLVAILSLASVLIPVVFFVLDVSQPSIATWGEYIRWVGAAAASVVVWEWVERIEALERDEMKDGILGREIFDGDEMLDMGSEGRSSNTSRYFGFGKRSSWNGNDEKKVSMMPIPTVRPRFHFRKNKVANEKMNRRKSHKPDGPTTNGDVAGPPQTTTPVSRSDTTSAASTVYAVRYQNVSSPPPAIPEAAAHRSRQTSVQINGQIAPLETTESSTHANKPIQTANLPESQPEEARGKDDASRRQVWQAVPNPFKRKRTEPPAEVAAQMAASNVRRSPAQTYHNLRDRLGAFTVAQRSRLAGRARTGPSPPIPVTVIPAQPRPSRVTNTIFEESAQNSRQPSMTPSRDRRSSRRGSLAVTVIPAPIRGARTWSPDDMKDTQHEPATPTPPPQAHAQPGNATTDASSHAHVDDTPLHSDQFHVTPPADEVTTVRGALTISESPVRVRESDNRNATSTNWSSARFRVTTINSLDDRLSSVSPGSAARSNRGNGIEIESQAMPQEDTKAEESLATEKAGGNVNSTDKTIIEDEGKTTARISINSQQSGHDGEG
ncbi:pH-response regulator protein palH/rim21 [Lithohypha guttulata]|uniref:PH-response regulator protein palH/rim21 n=1 Tax=Lithohypha guttulata TaxID=1690604 RepID=A0AAN7YAE7_9EURO|nr:pH-response regulator protein palH/rim21 [Lithohypha guttulata]